MNTHTNNPSHPNCVLHYRYLRAGQEPKWTADSIQQAYGAGAVTPTSRLSNRYGLYCMHGVVTRPRHTTTGLAWAPHAIYWYSKDLHRSLSGYRAGSTRNTHYTRREWGNSSHGFLVLAGMRRRWKCLDQRLPRRRTRRREESRRNSEGLCIFVSERKSRCNADEVGVTRCAGAMDATRQFRMEHMSRVDALKTRNSQSNACSASCIQRTISTHNAHRPAMVATGDDPSDSPLCPGDGKSALPSILWIASAVLFRRPCKAIVGVSTFEPLINGVTSPEPFRRTSIAYSQCDPAPFDCVSDELRTRRP